jgi:hypothetical protein
MAASRGKHRAHRGSDSFELAVTVDLFGEPLKPFQFFCEPALTFVWDVAAQLAPGDAYCAAQQFVDYGQRNDRRKKRRNKQ